jgi:hypothetical protein
MLSEVVGAGEGFVAEGADVWSFLGVGSDVAFEVL